MVGLAPLGPPYLFRPILLSPRRVRFILVIMQHSHRRCVEIVELPSTHGPDERGDAAGGQERGNRHKNVDHAHRSPSPNVRTVYARAKTVKLLIGIRMAAIKGLITPVTANVPATEL